MRGGLRVGAPGSARTRPVSTVPGVPSRTSRPNLLLYVVAAALLAYMWRFQDIFPALARLRPTTVLSIVALGIAAITVDHAAGLRRLRSPVMIRLGLMLALVLVGIPFSLDPAATRSFLISWLLPSALLAVLIVLSVRTMDDLEWLAAVTLVGGCAYTALMLLTRPLDATGRWTTIVFYDPNDLALVMVGLLPLTLYFAWRVRSAVRRILPAVCFVLFVFTIVRTGSRGGFLGLAVVLGYLLIAFRALPTRARMLGGLAAVLLLIAGGAGYWERMRTMMQPSTDYNWSGREYTGRGALWRRGLGYLRERPLVGVGANAFVAAERDLSPAARRRQMAGRPVRTLVAHSTIVQIGAELGIPGLIIFAVLIVQSAITLRRAGRAPRVDPRLGAMSQALTGSLIGYVICGLFLSAAYFTFLHFLIGFVAATKELADAEPAPAPTRERGGYGLPIPSPLRVARR
jgi:putative inorganic carbon (HCO3(-)) transporter